MTHGVVIRCHWRSFLVYSHFSGELDKVDECILSTGIIPIPQIYMAKFFAASVRIGLKIRREIFGNGFERLFIEERVHLSKEEDARPMFVSRSIV